jgi:hypothetical protein
MAGQEARTRAKPLKKMAVPAGFEPTIVGLEGRKNPLQINENLENYLAISWPKTGEV